MNRKLSDAKESEDRVLKVIQRHGRLTAVEVSRYMRGMGALEAKNILDKLCQAGVLEAQATHHSIKYGYVSPEP